MITFYPPDQQSLFTNREYELAQLDHYLQSLQTGTAEHVALFGLRRIGKTLLLKEFMRRMLQKNPSILPVYMDFSALASSPENFALGYVGLVCYWVLKRGEGDAEPFLNPTTLPGAMIRNEGAEIYSFLESVLRELEKARPDRQALIRSAFHFPQEVGQARQLKLVLIFDEFQEIRTLTRFPNSQNVLALLRAEMQAQSGILYVLSGSAVSVLTDLLSNPESPLFTQFARLAIEAFNRDGTKQLVRKLKANQAGADLAPVIHPLTTGHPFYITAVCRRLMNLVEAAHRPMDADTVKQAFLAKTLAPHGSIYDFCRYVYDLSLQKAAGYGALKAVLQILATEEGLTATQIARRLRVTAATASDYLRWLREVGLVLEKEHQYYFRDPVLRFWVANVVRGVEVSLTAEPIDLVGLMARLDSLFQRASEELGEAQESAIRELMRRFDGRPVDGAICGRQGKVVLPQFAQVEAYQSPDGQTLLDAVGETSDGEKWILEVKRRSKRSGRKEVERLAALAEAMGAQAWFVSRAGFSGEAMEYAGKRGIYLTDAQNLWELRRLLGKQA